MDINSLLSPADTTRAASQTPGSSTPNIAQSQSHGRHSGPSPMVNSPHAHAVQPASSIPAHVRSPSQQPPYPSPLISPVPIDSANAARPRMSSVPSLEALPDLAPTKITPPSLMSRDSHESQKSSSGLFPHLTSAGATSNPRGSIDITMVDTPKQQVRSDYSDTSLPIDSQQRLAVLAAYFQESPSSYEAHKEIISLLHQGFINHIYPPSDPDARREPHLYDLLNDLRQARTNLDKLFAVGEEQWLDWLQDESILAQTMDERVAVVDFCRRAVTEEYGSTHLWVTYGDWVSHCHKWALDSAGDVNGEPDAERLVGREVFDEDLVLETWTEAIKCTEHDMSSSHMVWNKYMTVRFGDLDQNMDSGKASTVLDLFETRLRVPHAEWQQTFQAFSSFVSANVPNERYEEIMASNLRDSADAKKLWNDRDSFETVFLQARTSGDTTAEYQALSTYVQWERGQQDKPQTSRRGKNKRAQESRVSQFDMVDALYQRAELRFPSVLELWQDHIDYLIEKGKPALLTLARATKHCPWSGLLWKQYLLASELAEDIFDETERIKHKATSTGLLDAAGIEEALLVYDAWCGYLLRRSKKPDATEEDSDVAEMGIRSSIEAVHSHASKLGLGGAFDPSFRLQRKYVEYLKSQGRLDNAGAQFNDAVADYGKHYKFWLRYYEFEMQKSTQMALLQKSGPDRLGTLSSAPFAAGILKQALQQPGLDYPEPIIETLLNHCEDYEDAEELQSSISIVRKVQKSIDVKRQWEAQQASEIAAQKVQAEEDVATRTQEVANGLHIGKRKRDDEAEESEAVKRQRNEEVAEESIEKKSVVAEELKRDREHASVLVQNIPTNVTETKIRQYFSACGLVKQLKFTQDEDNSVIVEFEDADAAKFALSRDGREFEGSELSIVLNTGSTLFVTNYPASADETYIRNLFRAYGEILNVRLPSLQRNKKRRFCYVEFKQASDAQSATELDGKEVDGLILVAKISNPGAREARKETSNVDRQVFVGQLAFKAKRGEVEKLFSQYGEVKRVKLPQDEKSLSRNRGIAFVTFAQPEEAQAALAMDGQEFQGRKLTVSLTSDRDSRSTKGAKSRTKSLSAQPDGLGAPPRAPKAIKDEDKADRQERTVAICDVPDTVNNIRIKAAAEKIGAVRKVILKTRHQGALIEFESVADAGRAMIELENLEIAPGRTIHVTTEKEMLQQAPELKTEQFSKRPNVNAAPAAGMVKRPAQPGARKKGGHLGMRSAGLMGLENKDDAPASTNGDGGKKSNDDFRNMISKG